ncbi:hypothetical protein [Streptomyces sp. GQFP]|uniref:hypothetical protein n=1 Tax=Streptomyces sp. GQFP TaxID=2907545 RepID=UPI001F23AA42|nr:hypothetical protein [Streptomyces sp. GQFP]UIX31608.1 hypothetical protein LUX31_17050 [Streptomyces sp. GQFP]
MHGEPLTADSLADWSLPAADEDGYSGIVTFSTGQEMEDFWEENGYVLDALGERPFSVFYRLHAQALRARTVAGVESVSAEGALAVEGTGLLLSEYFAVSVLTPEDPASDPFSARVLSDFVEAFGLLARS